jgi:hypothetical protein
MAVPYHLGEALPLSLDPRHLPYYALRTTLRMVAAMVLSLLFTFTYATFAAKSRRAEALLIPILDVLQSVPILGFLSITVVGFIHLFHGSLLGPEAAAVFAIFTSQAWNMAFSFYHSLKMVPKDLSQAAHLFRLSSWQRFWKLEVPFALPSLVWNAMMSASGGWFFVVASEAISVSGRHIFLPGVGSYIALAQVSGVLEQLDQFGDYGGAELSELTEEMHLDLDTLFAIVDALELLGLAHVAERRIRMTRLGKVFVDGDQQQRRRIFAEHLVRRVPLVAHILRVLDERPQRRAPEERFLRELEDRLSEQESERVLSVVIQWARYAELLDYDYDAGVLSMGTPDEQQGA